MRLIKTSACIMAIAMSAFCSCNDQNKEDENATVVNVEKGVASPVWNSEGSKQAEEELYDQPIGLETDEEDPDSIMQAETEVKPAPTETKNVRTNEITYSEE